MDAPPAAFTQLSASRRVPVAILRPAGAEAGDNSKVNVRVCDNNDEIEALMESFGCPGLHLPDSSPDGQLERDAERSFEDLYKHLSGFVRSSAGNVGPLLNSLGKLDAYLRSRAPYGKFLLGDEMSFADCLLMPRLQHLRVAAKAYRDWDLPPEYSYVWRYMNAMYASPAFDVSCPNDRDLMVHYDGKTDLKPLAGKPSLLPPTRSFSLPPGVVLPDTPPNPEQ